MQVSQKVNFKMTPSELTIGENLLIASVENVKVGRLNLMLQENRMAKLLDYGSEDIRIAVQMAIMLFEKPYNLKILVSEEQMPYNDEDAFWQKLNPDNNNWVKCRIQQRGSNSFVWALALSAQTLMSVFPNSSDYTFYRANGISP